MRMGFIHNKLQVGSLCVALIAIQGGSSFFRHDKVLMVLAESFPMYVRGSLSTTLCHTGDIHSKYDFTMNYISESQIRLSGLNLLESTSPLSEPPNLRFCCYDYPGLG